MTHSHRRLFVAVDPPVAERDRLAGEVTTAALARSDVRMVDPELWHITLAFYGDVAAESEAELLGRLERAAARTRPFEIRLEHAGSFPADPRRAKVVWTGVGGDLEELRRLSDRCRAAGRRSGLNLPKERFHPHLTLARSRRAPADVDAPLAHLWHYCGDPWPVTSFRLIHSTLGSTVRHEPVSELSLID